MVRRIKDSTIILQTQVICKFLFKKKENTYMLATNSKLPSIKIALRNGKLTS
jgi:hypothetical protein